jgi:hypothetical protein
MKAPKDKPISENPEESWFLSIPLESS